MGVAVRSLDRLAFVLGHRQTGNCHWLAPQGLPAVLDMESSSRPTRAPSGVERDSPTDSQDEPRESALGRAPHPRRIAQTRHRDRRDQRGQVHRTQSEAAVARGGPSWKITSRTWCRLNSSLCRRSGFRSCTCSWFWLTTEGGSCISTSPPIRRPSGPRSNSGRPFALIRSRGTCFGTATESTAVKFWHICTLFAISNICRPSGPPCSGATWH